MSRPKNPLVEQKRPQLTQFKIECAKEIGHESYIKENNDHYKGDVSAAQNGHEGGPIGGQMVKRMIEYAEKKMFD